MAEQTATITPLFTETWHERVERLAVKLETLRDIPADKRTRKQIAEMQRTAYALGMHMRDVPR